MKEFEDLVAKKTANALKIENLEPLIQERVDKAVKDIIDTSFRSFGDTYKSIETHIKENVTVDLSEVSLQEYNKHLTEMITASINSVIKDDLTAQMMDEINALLKPAPKEITMQELVQPFLEEWRQEYIECGGYDMSEYAHYEYVEKESSPSLGTRCEFKLWKRTPDTSGLSRIPQPELRLYVLGGKIRIIWHDGSNIHISNFGTTIYNGFADLYQMYAAGTIITDIDDEPDLDNYIGFD